MKRIIIFAIALLTSKIIYAQGTLYLSNLTQTSTGSEAAGSDSSLAALFNTGNSADGYLLDSVQLAMANATGDPSDFTVMIYSAMFGDAILPGSNVGTLSGSTDPSTAGIYNYTDASNLILSPSTDYFIVLTAGATVANGAYEWSHAGAYSYNQNSGWNTFANIFHSSNGSSWASSSSIDPQFAIVATPIPEPSSSFLLLLGSGVFMYVRRTFNR